MLHEHLWQASLDLARACLKHPFVTGLADGTLDREAFKRYVAQDAFFLRAFYRAYALAAAKAVDPGVSQKLHAFMGGALEELKLHGSYAGKWDIDLQDVRPFPATSAYTDFLLRTAWHETPDVTASAMAPCMRLYAFLGQELAKDPNPGNPYQEWVDQYASAEFEALAAEVESLLDEVAEDTPMVRDAYGYAMRCELDFFGAPLEAAS